MLWILVNNLADCCWISPLLQTLVWGKANKGRYPNLVIGETQVLPAPVAGASMNQNQASPMAGTRCDHRSFCFLFIPSLHLYSSFGSMAETPSAPAMEVSTASKSSGLFLGARDNP